MVTELELQIKNAFSGVLKPMTLREFTSINKNSPDYEDVIWFFNKNWTEITIDDWKNHIDALFHFSSKAYLYFLPSILSLGVLFPNEEYFLSMFLSPIDRSPSPEYWDIWFLERFEILSVAQIHTIQDWLLFLSESKDSYISDDVLSNAYETLSLLSTHVANSQKNRRIFNPKE